MIRVVIGVLWRRHRVLVGKRALDGFLPNIWEFPGGKVEATETDQQALSREWEEELTLKITVGRELAVSHFGPEFVGHPFTTVTYLVSGEGEPFPVVHQELAWVSPDQLLTMEVAPSLREMLDNGHDFLRS